MLALRLEDVYDCFDSTIRKYWKKRIDYYC